MLRVVMLFGRLNVAIITISNVMALCILTAVLIIYNTMLINKMATVLILVIRKIISIVDIIINIEDYKWQWSTNSGRSDNGWTKTVAYCKITDIDNIQGKGRSAHGMMKLRSL